MNKVLTLIPAIIAAAILISGCRKRTAPEPAAANIPLPEPPLVATCPPGIPGGRLVIATYGDPKTFNPITANEQTSLEISRHLFEGLTGLDAVSQQVLPALAESWTNSPDGKTWTFKLRKNLRWSDGEPLTADDVVFTWNAIYDPGNINPTRDLFVINGKEFTVTKIDDLDVQVVTPEVYAPFLTFFGGVPILPRHVLGNTLADKSFGSSYGVNWDANKVVGCGPFRLKSYQPAESLLLERNPYFYEVDSNGQHMPYFDNVIYTIVPDFNATSLRFLSGESDADDRIFPFEYDHFKDASASGKFDVLDPGVGLETAFFWFNENTNVDKQGKPYVDPVKLKWFRDTKFRQACSYAIDRQAILKSVYDGRGTPNYGFITPGNKVWYNTNTPHYTQDLAKATSLLTEIGIEKRNGDDFLTDADGNKIEFSLNTNVGNSAREKTAVLIKDDLEKLGIKVIFQPIEFNTFIQRITVTFDYECGLLSLGSGGSTDPSAAMNVLKSSGFTHQWFPRQTAPSTPWEARMDYLMDAQNSTLDFNLRKKYFDEVQEIMSEQLPLIFTVSPQFYCAMRSDIGNVRATALSDYAATWNIEELYFKK